MSNIVTRLYLIVDIAFIIVSSPFIPHIQWSSGGLLGSFQNSKPLAAAEVLWQTPSRHFYQVNILQLADEYGS